MDFRLNKRMTLMITFSLFVALIFVFSSLPTAFAKEKTIKLKFAYWMPTKHTLHRVYDKFAKEVKVRTNGAVEITLYPGGALGKPKEQWDMALGGIADLSFLMPGYTAGRFPLSTVFDLPLIAGGSCTVNTASEAPVSTLHQKNTQQEDDLIYGYRK